MGGHKPLARAELPIDTVLLARFLIGKILVRELPEGIASGRIVDTEAYVVGDAAGHAYRGMTKRNRSFFLERRPAYVYLAYGVSYLLNVSSETQGIGAGVLIRALEPLQGVPLMKLNRGIERVRDLPRDGPEGDGSWAVISSPQPWRPRRTACSTRGNAKGRPHSTPRGVLVCSDPSL